ncbi:Major facilitator superfamily domain general substrate transporter [Penicillium brevicompactum]|uniref:Major facilitator superfamily domain general substrate transporter n=1 Tax=Penicillium brevicompactum TaxID=5074 RepID=UPI002540DF06|nr:Major facilitator superfamily domain general substrate transporter [Penicillium brevicompactum]KAJ5332322.1 Major facilitator superfamily domain general substrate transporter [Penicillium brevicompactum]
MSTPQASTSQNTLQDSEELDRLEQEKPTSKFPEGGTRAWMVVLGAFCVSFSTFGYMNAFGVYQEYYTEHFLAHESSSNIAWIGSVQVCFLFSGSLIGGPLFDRYGASIIHVPAIGIVLSVMMTSLCKTYYQFMLAQGALGGISSGMLFAPVMTCVSHYFHTRRAAALGVTVSGSSIGGVLFPIALTQMLRNKSLGFGWSVRIAGFLILFMVSIAMATIKERLPPRQGKILLPSAFTRASYTLVTFGIFFMMWGMFTPFFYLPQYAQSHGMSSHLSSYILSIVNAASVPGRILPGLAADKLGRYNILIINGACAGILLLCWIATSSNASIIVFSVLYGFFSGGIVSLMSPCIAQVTPSPDQIGTHLGMSMAIIGLAGLTGTPICGALLERYGSYTQAAVFSGVVMLVGAFLVTVARFNLQAKFLKIV